MMGMYLMLGALCLFNLGFTKELEYFSNFKPGPIRNGPESVVTDFVTMTNDPGSNLPDAFTICSSLYIDFLTTLQNIFHIMKEDGTPWFAISYAVTRMSTREEIVLLIQSGIDQLQFFLCLCFDPFFYRDKRRSHLSSK